MIQEQDKALRVVVHVIHVGYSPWVFAGFGESPDSNQKTMKLIAFVILSAEIVFWGKTSSCFHFAKSHTSPIVDFMQEPYLCVPLVAQMSNGGLVVTLCYNLI